MATHTKNRIAETFLKLSLTKSIDKITVTDITRECGISRQTFYYHFNDMSDVIAWSIEKLAKEMLEQSLRDDNPADAINNILTTGDNYSEIIVSIMRSNKRQEFEEVIVYDIKSYLMEYVKNNRPNAKVTPTDLDMFLDFYSFGITGVLLKCIENNVTSSEIITDRIVRIVRGDILRQIVGIKEEQQSLQEP